MHILYLKRRAAQWGFILALILIPVLGLFRIDPVDGAFVILDRQIWFSDFFLVFGMWMMLSVGLVLLYSLVGTAFCGWACPQNTMSEWANYLTHKLLGKRAEVSLDGEAPIVAHRKNRLVNWLVLASLLLLGALFMALIPMLYFYEPGAVLSFVLFQDDARLAGSMYWIYTVFVLILYLDLAFIRHFWCRFMCIYKVWQHTFKTRNTLKIHYEESRSQACEKCNYCANSCFLDLDPRNTLEFDSCINCGACIVACDKMHNKSGGVGLLSFNFGIKRGVFSNLSNMFQRLHWAVPILLLGFTMFVWGLLSYSPLHATVYRGDGREGYGKNDYTINVAHKLYSEKSVNIMVDGLDEQYYQLHQDNIRFDSVGRQTVRLSLSPDLPPGIHRFVVVLSDPTGRRIKLMGRHFSQRGS